MKLILFNCFGTERRTVLSVINWGEMIGDKIRYLTKDGWQEKTDAQLRQNSATTCKFEDLDLKDSLYYWFEKNRDQYSKPIEIDYTIETGEVYSGSCWHLSLMIDKSGDTIKVKPIYN